MSEALCLSRDEVRQMARSRTKAGQARFLRQNGIRHYIDAHGWPVVLRSAVEPQTGVQSAPEWKSNKVA